MDYFTIIGPEFLDKLGDFDRETYRDTIEKLGVWGYLQYQKVALLGHFVFTGDGHGNVYVNIRDLNDTMKLCPLAIQMAWECRNKTLDGIVGTPHGADTLAVMVAYYYTLFTGIPVEILKPLKGQQGLEWYKDHGERVRGMRIMQIEDVINAGKSLRETADFIITSGGNLVGFIAVCLRISKKNPGLVALQEEYYVDFGRALTDIEAVNHSVDILSDPREQCPLCAAGIPIDLRVGHGQKFLNRIVCYPDLHALLAAR